MITPMTNAVPSSLVIFQSSGSIFDGARSQAMTIAVKSGGQLELNTCNALRCVPVKTAINTTSEGFSAKLKARMASPRKNKTCRVRLIR